MNKIHLDVKPYKCNLFEKTFFVEAHLKRHLKGMLLSCQGKIEFGDAKMDSTT